MDLEKFNEKIFPSLKKVAKGIVGTIGLSLIGFGIYWISSG